MAADYPVSEGPVCDRWLSPEDAQREIDRFLDRFGVKTLYLASHAALPLVLSPELIHLLRINFLEEMTVPAIAEADLLLSQLCRPMDEPLYEMEPRIRKILLEYLSVDFGPERPIEVARFLMAWLGEKPVRERFSGETEAHEWVMMAWLEPEAAISELSGALDLVSSSDTRRADRLRVFQLVEALATPFSMESVVDGYHVLRARSRAAAEGVFGDTATAEVPVESGSPSPGDILEIHLGKSRVPMRFVYIPPGEFTMGSPTEEPGRDDDEKQHKVILTEGFFMQETPVTQAQWEAVMGKNPSHFKECGPECPVESVSWDDAQAFLDKLNRQGGDYEYRLPTEAQWEYACRAGTKTRYNSGDSEADLDRAGWYDKNSGSKTHPVGQKAPNAFGLYDMHGNVWEWCSDRFGDYPEGPVADPTGPDDGASRVSRGGSWIIAAGYCRSACRSHGSPDYRGRVLGFRALAVRGPR